MSKQFVESFLNGNRVKCNAITAVEAKDVIVEGMVLRTNYDAYDGCEGIVSHWDGGYCYMRLDSGSMHYLHWSNARSAGNWVETDRIVSKKATSLRMKDVVLDEEKKELIKAAVSQVENYALIFEEWGFDEVFEKGTAIAVLMWGPPGTGKTIMSQAIANELGLKLEIIQAGQIWSSEPGAAERTIAEKFAEATSGKKLLLFDECDSLIADRNEVGMILAAQINTLLSCLENFTGVVVFTTNRLGTMDPAFERRVSVKIEFPFPTQQQRLHIWKLLIPSKAPIDSNVSLEVLSHVPIAGGNIKNVILNAARMAAFKKKKTIDSSCFEVALEREGQAIKDFEANINSKPHMVGTYGPPQQMHATSEGGLQVAIDKFREASSQNALLSKKTTGRVVRAKPAARKMTGPIKRMPAKKEVKPSE